VKKRFISYFHGLTPDALRPVRRPERTPAWLPADRTTIVPRASHALYLSWRVMGLARGDRFLCPAFVCNTVSRPLEKAGGRAAFFNVTENLGIDWDHLRSLLAGPRRPKAMVWYHYLGLPMEFDRVLAFCRENDLLLIEDCAHALFSEHAGRLVGSFGDVAVFSIRKTLPVLHAGALVVNNPAFPRKIPVAWRQPTERLQAYLHAREAYLHRLHLQAVDRGAEVARPFFREALTDMERHYGDPAVFWAIDPLSRLVMHNAERERIRRLRRRNFLIYLRKLGDLALVPALPAGANPMGFPVCLKRRDQISRRLHALGVETVPHWRERLLPQGVAARFGAADQLARTELTLPCHQDITPRDARYVCRCIRDAARTQRGG